MNEEERYEADEARKAAEDAECQAAGLCPWAWTSALPHPPYGMEYLTRCGTHPDCPAHGDAK